MPSYDATIKLPVNCPNDQAARAAVDELKRFLANPIVKMTLTSKGITLMGEPEVVVTRKK